MKKKKKISKKIVFFQNYLFRRVNSIKQIMTSNITKFVYENQFFEFFEFFVFRFVFNFVHNDLLINVLIIFVLIS